MRIKKYEASDMKEAIKMIKKDFGTEAIILHSRTISKGGLFGLFAHDIVEVMAGVDINIMDGDKPIISPVTTMHKGGELMPITSSLEKKVTSLSKEMDDIKETLQIIVKKVVNSPHPMISHKLIPYYKILERTGMGEDTIIGILQEIETNFKGVELENSDRILSYIKHKVVQLLKVPTPLDFTKPGTKRLVALVGPTGVGKTTTIAKMAANFSLIQKKEVALITIDTFRIAAIEQLRDYANIIGIPMEVVFTLDDFTRALRRFKTADLILIDTAGRSPKNNEQILDLKKFLRSNYIDTHLVLSATAKPQDIMSTIKRYESLGGDKVIFTKLDETDSCGVMVDVVDKLNRQLTYITTGQNVPDDFEVADAQRIADLMFEGIIV